MLTTNMDAIGGALPNVLGGGQEEKGEMARLSSFIGAIAVADLVKTTLGPKGMVYTIIHSLIFFIVNFHYHRIKFYNP